MFGPQAQKYTSCFISAPIGLELKELPELLREMGIAWEWAKPDAAQVYSTPSAVRAADLFIGVLNGTQGDYRVLYEAGIAVGLSKPTLLLATRSRLVPFGEGQFSIAKVRLSDRKALEFHIKIFLATPPRDVFEEASKNKQAANVPDLSAPAPARATSPEMALENRVFRIVESNGGAAIVEPGVTDGDRYRPDLLIWLAEQDETFLQPAVVEVKRSVNPDSARRVEEQLLKFMAATGVRTGFLLTEIAPPERSQQLSPNIIWLQVDEFERLVQTSRLGTHVRQTRNRLVHGVR